MKAKLFRALQVALTATVLFASACAEDLKTNDEPMDMGDGGPGPASGIVTTEEGDGTYTTVVDASANETWRYFDFESREETQPATPEDSADWDLGFQRFKISSNGGISGSGGVTVAVLPEQDFEALEQAPASGYLEDADDGDDENTDPDLAFLAGDGWYIYDPSDHTLSPRDVVYVVRSVEGNYFKVQVTDYYDSAGTGGFVAFRWGAVEPPSADDAISVDASDAETWVYVSVASAGVVSISDPASSTDWDLAFNRTQIQTNSGTSGPGLGGARLVPERGTYEATSASPTIGFSADAMLPLPGPPGSGEFSGNAVLNGWYNYDSTTHEVSTKGDVYLIRTAGGEYGKLEILGYDGGVFSLRLAAVTREVTVQTSTIDASDAEAWVYLDLRLGEIVALEDASASMGWDLGVSRTMLRTNSGTSGPGGGGALDPEATSLGDVEEAPAEGYAADEMLPLPGPPGSGEFSGNPTLNGWYDYDSTTHVTTPKDMAFVLRTADEGVVKLEITDYADGVLTIDWAYAGAGQDTF